MTQKIYKTKKPIEEMTEYMDTLVRYVFYKLKKENPNGHDTIYYPAYYLHKKQVSDSDFKHLDEGYKYVTITLRKVTNQATSIIVKLEDIQTTDWRYGMLNSTYQKIISIIDKSLDNYEEVVAYINKGVKE